MGCLEDIAPSLADSQFIQSTNISGALSVCSFIKVLGSQDEQAGMAVLLRGCSEYRQFYIGHSPV
jgi:hypothetical protein